jgi:hypothetical protein
MSSQPRVIFRREPEKPDRLQAVRNIEYGTAMEDGDIAVVRTALRNTLDLYIPALKETPRDGGAFLSCFKNRSNGPIVLGDYILAAGAQLFLSGH